MTPYWKLEGFENVYFEDSYVLGIDVSETCIVFQLEVVLTEGHPVYVSPPPDHQHCYRSGRLIFEDVYDFELIKSGARPAIDARGEADMGNIDEFSKGQPAYVLNGGWGTLRVECGSARVEVRPLTTECSS